MSPELDPGVHCTTTLGGPVLQGSHLVGSQLVATHTPVKPCPFHITDSVGHDNYDRELSGCGFLISGSVQLRESADEGKEARFIVFAIEPQLVPSLKQSLHREI
jgi:hypothetical protein